MKSIQLHFQAILLVIKYLSQGKFLLYFIPGLVIAVIYLLITNDLNDIVNSASQSTEEMSWIAKWYDWGLGKTVGIIKFISDQIYIFFILTLLSPFNTFLSEKVDTELTGTSFPVSIFQIISDLIRMIFVVAISIFLELVFLALYYLISLMFGLDSIDPIMYFVIASFFYGISFYDYSLERYKKDTFSSFGFAFSKLLMVMLTGAIFQAIYLIPFIGIPISPVVATMVATIVYIHQQQIPLKNDRTATELSQTKH